jgi:hypothetical protein
MRCALPLRAGREAPVLVISNEGVMTHLHDIVISNEGVLLHLLVRLTQVGKIVTF